MSDDALTRALAARRLAGGRTLDDQMVEYGFDPAAERLNVLPNPNGSWNPRDWTAPQWLYDMAKAAALPGHAAQGGSWGADDVTSAALNVGLLGGVAGMASAPKGALAMGAARLPTRNSTLLKVLDPGDRPQTHVGDLQLRVPDASKVINGTTYYSHPIMARANPDIGYGDKVIVGKNGLAIYETRDGSTYMDRARESRIISELYKSLDPNYQNYFRFTDNKNELDLINSGSIRPSRNYAEGFNEIGLSVAESPHYAVEGFKYGYGLKGDRIGTGSDGEPLLDLKSLQPITGIVPAARLVAIDAALANKKAADIGWDSMQVKGATIKPRLVPLEEYASKIETEMPYEELIQALLRAGRTDLLGANASPGLSAAIGTARSAGADQPPAAPQPEDDDELRRRLLANYLAGGA